jgi:molybdate transport system regulatory protein
MVETKLTLRVDFGGNRFRQAVVAARPGGSQGGGARLTKFGERLIRDYRTIERSASRSAKIRLRGLESLLRPTARHPAKLRKRTIRSRAH